MNIVQLNSVFGLGSTGRIVADLQKALEGHGHQGYVAYGRQALEPSGNSYRVGNTMDNYLHGIRTRLFDDHGFGSYLATKELIGRIKNLDPDLVHLHNLHGYYLHVGLLFEYLKHSGKPLIWTLHDCWAFTGHCAHFDFVNCARWEEECHNCPLKSRYPKSLVMDRSRQNYRLKKKLFSGASRMTVVTPSKWLAELVQRSFLGDYPLTVIPNWVDLDAFRPTVSDFRNRHDLKDKFIILGVASKWDERKGYGYFMDLAKKLHPDGWIVLVGIKEKNLKHLPPQVLGVPGTNSVKKLAEIYSAADIFVNPTLEEVLGVVNLEALACGTPVVTFNSGGSPECLDTDCGKVVPRGDLRGLLDAIESVRASGKDALRPYCLERVKRIYDRDLRVADYMGLYRQALFS